MAWQEDAHRLGLALVEAYNNKDGAGVDALIREVSREASILPTNDRSAFRSGILHTFRSQPLRIEKQANSSLHELLKAIEEALREGHGSQ